MSTKKIVEELEFELKEIDNLLDLYREELIELNREPNPVELIALAGVLHSFYSGAEKIFLIIAKRVDKKIPYDINWHKTLLYQMAKENEYRKAIISDTTADELLEYLGFRHFYRHSYSSHLKWSEMEHLVMHIKQTWEKFKTEILSFIKDWKLKNMGSAGI